MDGNAKLNADNWRGTGFFFDRTRIATSQAFPAPAVYTTSAGQAFQDVLDRAGATLPGRDVVDRCIVSEVRKGEGQIIKSPKEALNRCTED